MYYKVSMQSASGEMMPTFQVSRIEEADSREEAIQKAMDREKALNTNNRGFKCRLISCEETTKFMYEVQRYMDHEVDVSAVVAEIA